MCDSVSPELAGLLGAARHAIEATPLDVRAVHAALEDLLGFLVSSGGYTQANIRNADAFFRSQYDWSRDSDGLPAPYDGIVCDLGMQLHDTFSAPEVAINFESTPEQLLARLRGGVTNRRET